MEGYKNESGARLFFRLVSWVAEWGWLLLLVLPSNVYAAFQRIDFGGHGAGPAYLLVRVPLQLFLIGWIYWFAVKQP